MFPGKDTMAQWKNGRLLAIFKASSRDFELQRERHSLIDAFID